MHHFIRDSYEKKLIQVIKIHTDHNVADLLTKAFDVSRLDERVCNIKQQWVKGQDNPLIPNTHPHLLNTLIKNQSLFNHHLNPKRPTNLGKPKGSLRYLSLSGPIHLVANETVYKEWEDIMERAATIASSLEAEQDSDRVFQGEKEMRDIVSLKTERELVRINIDDGNAFCNEIEVNAVPVNTAEIVSIAEIKTSAAPSTIVVSPPVITEVEITLAQTLVELKSAKSKVVIQEPVQSTITIAPSTIPKAKGITFRDAGEITTRTPTSVSSSSIKDKGKTKMVEPEVPLNKKDQIRLDEELVRRLDAEEQEAARLERENVELQEQATLAKIKEWDNMKAMMDADYELCKRLQEQDQGELTIEEKSKLFMELMNERKRHFAKLRAEEKRRKPLTKGQRRNQIG
ncbi:hypothetical protein Tco_1238256 [Tanacetum coccineum]